jgi:hypothetical protein
MVYALNLDWVTSCAVMVLVSLYVFYGAMRSRQGKRHNSIFILQWSSQVGLDGHDMQHEWERRGMHTGYWWESQNKRDH